MGPRPCSCCSYQLLDTKPERYLIAACLLCRSTVGSSNGGHRYQRSCWVRSSPGTSSSRVRVRFEGGIERINLRWPQHALSFLPLSLAGNLLPYYIPRSVLPEG